MPENSLCGWHTCFDLTAFLAIVSGYQIEYATNTGQRTNGYNKSKL